MPEPNNHSTMKNPVGRFMVAVGAMIQLEGTDKILLVQRAATQDWNPNEWEISYGRMAQFEDPVTTLKREVKEELGLVDLQPQRIVGVWRMLRGSEKAENEVIGITFHCLTRTEIVHLSAEHQEYRWATPQEALELIKVPGIKKDIQKFIASLEK